MAFQFAVNTASGGTLPTGLYSYKKVDSNSVDFVDANFNGTDTAISYANAGIIGNDATFDGSTSKITIPTADNNNFNTVSFSFWMKTSDATDEVLYYAADAAGAAIMYFRKCFTTANKLDFIIFNVTDTILTTTTSVTGGGWIHVVVTKTGANASIYINGNTTAEATSSAMNTANIGTTREWGNFTLAGILFYTGQLDEFGIWTKVLSANEITDLYNGGAGNALSVVSANSLTLLGVGA